MRQHSRSMKCLKLILLLCVSTAHQLDADTYPRQPDVDAVHHVPSVHHRSKRRDHGESTARLRFVTSKPKEVALDLVKSSGATGMTVSAVTCGGKPAPFTHQGSRLAITLTQPATAGGEVSCTTTYRGIPAGGLRIINNIHGERTAFSENWPDNARHWLPMIDHPCDKATGEFIVTAPRTTRSWPTVSSLKRPTSRVDCGGHTGSNRCRSRPGCMRWAWRASARGTTQRRRGVAQQVWVFRRTPPPASACSISPGAAPSTFSASTSARAPTKSAHVQAAGLGGGTEHATVIFYGEKGVAAGNAPVVHEVAHGGGTRSPNVIGMTCG